MPAQIPPCLKPIQGYLLRADEVESRDPIVAYYARIYALNRAVAEKMAEKNGPGMPVLLKLMDKLEIDKTKLAGEEAMSNNMLAHAHCENFVLSIFNYADTEDRAGRINKKIARCFLVAYQLFETLRTFEPELNPDIEEKIRYAKVKAAYITRCLRTGDIPQAGPLVGNDGAARVNAAVAGGDEPGAPPQIDPPPTIDGPGPSNIDLNSQEAYATKLQQEEYDMEAQRERQRLQDAQLQMQLQHQQFQQQQQQRQRELQARDAEAERLQQQIQQEQQRIAAIALQQQQAPLMSSHKSGSSGGIGSRRVNPHPTGDAAAKATKAIKFASSAIMYDDYETTVKYLVEAYDLLTV